jgi:phosphatidylglycerol:prolipoprotein diacylglycerol transferase
MAPILARYGSIFIYSYTVVLALGLLAATALTARLARRSHIHCWFDALLFVMVTAVVAGRGGFVLAQWPYYQEHPEEILHFAQGGLSYHAALLAGLAALWLWALFKGRSFYGDAALLAPGFALVVATGWLACWFEGCAYGQETAIGPVAADLPDEFGVFALRFQTQLIGLALALLAFFIILWLARRLSAAALFWSTLALVSLAHLLPGLMRGDPALMAGPLRVDVLLDGLLFLGALLMLQYSARRDR